MKNSLVPTPGAKMLYLIKRRATASREELIAHWFPRERSPAPGGEPVSFPDQGLLRRSEGWDAQRLAEILRSAQVAHRAQALHDARVDAHALLDDAPVLLGQVAIEEPAHALRLGRLPAD